MTAGPSSPTTAQEFLCSNFHLRSAPAPTAGSGMSSMTARMGPPGATIISGTTRADHASRRQEISLRQFALYKHHSVHTVTDGRSP